MAKILGPDGKQISADLDSRVMELQEVMVELTSRFAGIERVVFSMFHEVVKDKDEGKIAEWANEVDSDIDSTNKAIAQLLDNLKSGEKEVDG